MGYPHHLHRERAEVMAWFRRRYGAGPLHLLSLVACLAFAGYIVTRILAGPEGLRILVWFAGAAVAHDLVLWPLYAVADRGAVVAARRHPERLPRVPWVNYVRVPTILSAVLLAVSFPLVFRWSEPAYHNASGLTESPYLGRWLLLTGVAFGVSAVLYAWRVGRVMVKEKR
jgi:ABC-type transport system involved in cytochrome c biogenesis permease subunit